MQITSTRGFHRVGRRSFPAVRRLLNASSVAFGVASLIARAAWEQDRPPPPRPPPWILHSFNQILESSSTAQQSTHRPLAARLGGTWPPQSPQCCCRWFEGSREFRSDPGTHQLFGPHVVEDPLRVLAVVPALHDRQEQFWGVVLKGGKNTSNHCQESKNEEGTQLGHYHPGQGLERPGFWKHDPRARQILPASPLQGSSSLSSPSPPSPLITDIHNFVVCFYQFISRALLIGGHQTNPR